ncbi:hypothetical protein [Deinococcus sp. JMULE3]|uniref:hypothetical protein n=1 Tax=Deinococcus sp. JMULE3 TaxID=2518341 RepID=UPI00157691E1|nr:hypothetical protein [Deinococcus sp. JMULE3]NTY02040.1 hypothetical protein [Deinococcus sp. JMULE3]
MKTLSLLVIICIPLLTGCQDQKDSKTEPVSFKAALNGLDNAWATVYRNSNVEAALSVERSYSVLIPPDNIVQEVAGGDLVRFARTSVGRSFVLSHIIAPQVDINQTSIYRTLNGKLVRLEENQSPCRVTFNGIELQFCEDEPSGDIEGGSIFRVKNLLFR